MLNHWHWRLISIAGTKTKTMHRIIIIGLLLLVPSLSSATRNANNAVQLQFTAVADEDAKDNHHHLRSGGRLNGDSPYHDVFLLALHDNDDALLSDSKSMRRIQNQNNPNNNDNELQDGFVNDCQSYLFDPSTVEDGIISQTDFVSFLLHQCPPNEPACPQNTQDITFEQLDLSLQIKFIRGICHHEDLDDRSNCISNLNDMWMEGDEFGFETDGAEVEELVRDLCAETFEDVVEMGFVRAETSDLRIVQSASPTQTPSSNPTNAPSREPSHTATVEPSSSPTMRPSSIPTNAPSMHPHSNPPTSLPTEPPSTGSPTTRIPSFSPTTSPSNGVTDSPTGSPSAKSSSMAPSSVPTVGFTSSDSVIYPVAGSLRPTDVPTDGTTLSPTDPPSSLPSSSPSVEPTSKQEIPLSLQFANDCASYLLSQDFVHDGIISQMEFTRFLIHHCIQEGKCDDRTIITFEELDVSLQLEFIFGACAHDERVGRNQCVDDLESMWRNGNEFGFDAGVDDLRGDVEDMCYLSYGFVVGMGLAETPLPTELRTASPSVSPFASDPPTAKLPSLTPVPSLGNSAQSPSESPSDTDSNETGDGARGPPPGSAPRSDDSLSRRAVIGMSSALALSLVAACALCAYHYPRQGPGSSPDKYISKDANHFGIAAHEPWGKSIQSLPMSYMGMNCSLGSSSSSFRDYRFVNVFGPEGNLIPQFNPNTAGAVVIGSVTIGASSSISSGPFANTGSQSHSSKSRSFFAIGRRNNSSKSESGVSSRDDMSSLSSRRSSHRKNPKYRSPNNKGTMRLDGQNRVNTKIAIGSHYSTGSGSQSKVSRSTMPMSRRRWHKFERRANHNGEVSFGDWRAISYMTEFNHQSRATDAAAAIQQSKFFFETLLCHESASPSADGKSLSIQSLPNMNYLASGLSPVGAPSVLSESYFHDTSLIEPHSVTSTESDSGSRDRSSGNGVFVPWHNKGGFSSSLRLSDSRHSDESSFSAESDDVPTLKKRLGLIRPAKALFSKFRKRTRAKEWFSFKHRQYHHLNTGHFALQEDHDVVSMKSYSSQVLLLPPHMAAAKGDLPNLVLGTFAAAAMPMPTRQEPVIMFPKLLDSTIPESPSINETDEEKESTAPAVDTADSAGHPQIDTTKSNHIEQTHATAVHVAEAPTIPQVTRHISSLDTNFFTVNNDGSLELKHAALVQSTDTKKTPPVTRHISSLDSNMMCIEKNDSGSFYAYSRSDFDSSDPSKVSDWSDSRSDSSSGSSSTDTSQSGSNRVMDCSFAAATAPLVGNQVKSIGDSLIEGFVEDISFFSHGANLTDENTALDDESGPKTVHLIGISHLLSENESSEGSASPASGQNEASVSASNGLNDTNLVSHSSRSDADEPQFPSDGEDSVNNSGEYAEVLKDRDVELGCQVLMLQKSPEDISLIISDSDESQNETSQTVDGKETDCVALVESGDYKDEPANDPRISTIVLFSEKSSKENGVNQSVNISDDVSADDSLANTQLTNKKDKDQTSINYSLDAAEKGESPTILSISLSWDSDVGSEKSSYIGTMELDSSFASTIPVQNTSK